MKEAKDWIDAVVYFSPLVRCEYRIWNGYHFFTTSRVLGNIQLSRSEEYLAIL